MKREYEFLAAVDVVLGYHRDIVRSLAGGVPFAEYESLRAKSEASREILRRFGDVLDIKDRETYYERLRVRLDALSELAFMMKVTPERSVADGG